MDKIRQYMYYFLIGIVSFIALAFLPMVGTEIGMAWNIPTTTVGWIVWAAAKIIVSIINILIFHCFMCQAKLNVKDNEYYIKARDILVKIKEKNVLPKSPQKWNGEQYGKKGTTIFITSALSTVALSQALLTFDWISMLTYLFTIIMGLIFGVLQMKKAEEYWTDEYYRYALMIKSDREKEASQDINKQPEMALSATSRKSNKGAQDGYKRPRGAK